MARIDAILSLVKEQGASDLHMSAGSPPIVRINGEMMSVPYERLTPEISELLLFEIMDPQIRARYDADKDVDFSYEIPGVVRVRCNIYEQSRGVAGAFRILPNSVPTFEQLGLPDSVTRLAELQRGLVIVTGPPGTGKSSTLAALVNHINRTQKKHILTLEDPIEYRHENQQSLVTQREIGRNTPSFVQGLHGALREDPDVIMVGEMRDLETVSLAITASETGHLVLGTLHTSNASRTLDRLLDVFPVDQQDQIRVMVSESLRGVISQQLVPRIDGKGRVLALEILTNTPAVANVIREAKTFMLPGIIQTGRKQGMRLMDDSLTQLFDQGLISAEEACSRAEQKQAMRQHVGENPKS